MTFLPVGPWPVLLVLVVAALVAVWWNPASSSVPGESRATHWRLTLMVVLLGIASLRPAVPGDEVNASAANLNVYFVVDTTSSIIAEDYGNERPRIAGVQADIAAITEALPGARYSVITFDQATRVRLPLTTDSNALEAALETLLPEASEYSRGSSITAADERLGRMLEQSEERTPDRGRLVFYLGDGEQTASEPPAPFTIDKRLVGGGAVLGYGTTQGGRMKATRRVSTRPRPTSSTRRPARTPGPSSTRATCAASASSWACPTSTATRVTRSTPWSRASTSTASARATRSNSSGSGPVRSSTGRCSSGWPDSPCGSSVRASPPSHRPVAARRPPCEHRPAP